MDKLLPFLCHPVPRGLEPLVELALDLRWTWNHASDELWRLVDPRAWELTGNPWWILQSVSQKRLQELAADQQFLKHLHALNESFIKHAATPGWFKLNHPKSSLGCIAYFSMEFGLGEGLPLYAGGLGILAGDHLKTASDLAVPLVGIGLLYQEGYFRQIIADDGSQNTANPHNDPTSLPLRPVIDSSGGWLRVPLELPGRQLFLRIWEAKVGRIWLYLLDSNDPTNNPADRSLIYTLYDDRPEFRIMQEMALGIGGWRVLEALGIEPDVCHMNEGHPAFVIYERARSYMKRTGKPFDAALWATRGGNAFTTHTAVAAGFDVFPAGLVRQYLTDYAHTAGLPLDHLVSLGQANPADPDSPFNMAVLAGHGSTAINAVSKLHGKVSRHLFQPFFPRWPEYEVPVGHITNGVHMPTWDSRWADEIWTGATGKGCWAGTVDTLTTLMQKLSDEQIWSLRSQQRLELINYVRERLVDQFQQYGVSTATLEELGKVLDPNALTLGFARRFATYKRPNLLLHDRERLIRILTNTDRPVQLIVAGKAHPKDAEGKRLVQEMVRFAREPATRHRVVFLPDYDIAVAQELIQGIDVWINTPRRPWEACGTSGMKVLVNGGLNLSELDGWWAEAYRPEVGWAIGDGQEHPEPEWDALEAERLYDILEREIIPEFYDRDSSGIPRNWLRKVRTSLSELTPRFSSARMVREYVDGVYLPAADRFRQRSAGNGATAEKLAAWHAAVIQQWPEVHFGEVTVKQKDGNQDFTVQLYLGEMDPDFIRVELCADPEGDSGPDRLAMKRGEQLPGSVNGYTYLVSVSSGRPTEHYTPRVVAAHPTAVAPLENIHILWQK